MDSAQTLTLEGIPVPLDTPITIRSGVNWIPYLRHDAQDLQGLTSLAAPIFDYQNLDQIKSQSQFSTFYAGYGWYGSLTSMVPGQSYVLTTRERDRAL